MLDILPHREPMLFIDTVSRLVPGEEAVASFRARPELPCFAGHFPERRCSPASTPSRPPPRRRTS
ncbi:hypothetical protein M5E87_05400 [Flavonifractor plautii]|nr:hypothetical protein M5E87_05400 [Flavonifractor plautii]